MDAFVVLGLVLLGIVAKMLMTMMHKLENDAARANTQDEKNATAGEPGTDAVHEHNECDPVPVADARPTLTCAETETQVQRQAHIIHVATETTHVKWKACVARVSGCSLTPRACVSLRRSEV
jgi:hypothetical protein